MWTKKIVSITVYGILLSGCQSVPTVNLQDFVSAANALAQAESDYFDQLQTASDQSHQLIASTIYVARAASFAKIAPELTLRDDFSKAKAVRMAMMSQLQAYSQRLSAIAAAATGTWISDDAKANTTDVTKLLSDTKAAKVSTAEAGVIQSAVTQLTTAIINNETAKEIQSLATEASASIKQIGSVIAQDNRIIESDDFEAGLVEDQNQAMINVLHVIYDDRATNASQRFSVINTWRNWKPALVTKGKDITDALVKLEKANDALAAKQDFSAGELARQAFAAAQQALGIYSNVK